MTIKSLYNLLPPAARRMIRAHVQPLGRAIMRFTRDIQDRRLPVSILRQEGLAVACIGHDAEDPFILKRLFPSSSHTALSSLPTAHCRLPTIPKSHLHALVTDLAATVDLILISLNRSGHRDDPAEQGILIPQYVRQIRDAIAPDANPFKALGTQGEQGKHLFRQGARGDGERRDQRQADQSQACSVNTQGRTDGGGIRHRAFSGAA